VTTVESLHQTLQVFQQAFEEKGLSAAWGRVVGVVVQPGVEFGDDAVFEYDRAKARSLAAPLPRNPSLVYEAHSTDYQSPSALAQMVEDHFAILKVGPWLTFAFREAIFALSAIERELLGGEKSQRLSQLRETLDRIMLREPTTGARTTTGMKANYASRGPTAIATAADIIGMRARSRQRSRG
jgi:D-tagatose-1,6-bisphosphate aldolase subunit GatZ/KbaZ